MPPNRHRRTKAAAVQAAVATAQIPKPNGRIPAIANEDATQSLRAAIAATEADAKRQGKTNLELLQERYKERQAQRPEQDQKDPKGQHAQGQQQGGSSTGTLAHRQVGQQHGGTSTMAPALGQGTGVDLGAELSKKIRLPKPRSAASMDEVIWYSASMSAQAEVVQQYDVPAGLYQCYSSMCEVGKKLLVDGIHDKTHGIYDYRVSKAMGRAKRKGKQVHV